MSKNESKATDSDTNIVVDNMIEKVQDNVNTITGEFSKLQSQYVQSISNLQNQYMDATRNMIQNALSFQKAFSNNWPFYSLPNSYTDQIRNNSNELVTNYTRAINFGNQVSINSIDMISENLKNYTKSLAMFEQFNRNIFQSWNSFIATQQIK
jgi:hypothetical protein